MCQCNGICVNKKAEDNLKKNHQEKKQQRQFVLDSQVLGHFATICQMSGLCLGSETGQQRWLNDLSTYAPGCGPERPAPLHAAGAAGFIGAVDAGRLGLISCRTWQRSGLTYVR